MNNFVKDFGNIKLDIFKFLQFLIDFDLDDFSSCSTAMMNSFVMIEWVGDGLCDDATNILECQYDGGDCCLEEPVMDVCHYCICHEGSTTTTETSKVPIIITYYNGTHTVEIEYDFDDLLTTTANSSTEKGNFPSTEKYPMNSTSELKQTLPPKIEEAENHEKSNAYTSQSSLGFLHYLCAILFAL